MANIKIERLNHAFQEEISMILMTEIKDEDMYEIDTLDDLIKFDSSYLKYKGDENNEK